MAWWVPPEGVPAGFPADGGKHAWPRPSRSTQHEHAWQLQREAEPCLNCANIFAAATIAP